MSAKVAGYTIKEWKVAGIVFCVLLSVLVGWKIWAYESPAKARERLQVERDLKADQVAAQERAAAMNNAFGLCRKAILTIARDPEKSEVPYMFPVVEDGNWVWSWRQQTKMLRFRNGLGLEVAATGLCTVDRKAMRIEMLIVDDKIVLSPVGK